MSAKKQRNDKNQPSIVDILKSKKNKQQQEQESSVVVLDRSLLDKNDIISDENYEISKIAKKWFCDNSNIDQVIDIYLEKYQSLNLAKILIIDSTIRRVMDVQFRIHYPYNTFKFNSLQSEIIAKELLINPAIENESDLKRVTEFCAINQLKNCSINMNINNPLHQEIKTVIESKREKHGSEFLSHYNRVVSNRVFRKVYEKQERVEYVDLQTISLEEICEISNFKARALKKGDMDEYQFGTFHGQAYLNLYRTCPEIRFEDKKFLVKPRYYLLGNYISEDREALITKDMRTFFRKTNAMAILRQNREEFSKNLDPNLTKEEISRLVRNRFFLHYMRMPQRNMPPFHDLFIYQNYDDDEEENFNPEITPQPHDIAPQPITPSKLTYRRRQVCEKNPDQSNVATSSGSSTRTGVSVIENPIKINLAVEDFLREPDASNAEMDLVTILSKSPTLISPVREIILTQFPNDFGTIWSVANKRVSFLIAALYLLREYPKTLEEMMNNTLEDEFKAVAFKKFNDLQLACEDNHWTPPRITSTQSHEEPLQNLPQENVFDTSEGVLVIDEYEEVIFEQRNDFIPSVIAPVDPLQIKREPLSQHTPNPNPNRYSDVEILSLSDDEVIVLDSETEDDSMITALEEDNRECDLGRDRYQLQLNAESQEVTSDEQVQVATSPAPQACQSPVSENHSLHQYDLRIHQLEMGDRQEARSSKRKSKKQDRPQPKKKIKTNAGVMAFIESEEEQQSPDAAQK